MFFFSTILLATSLLPITLAAPGKKKPKPTNPTPPTDDEVNNGFPFNRVVVFGDDHSDNGNGSFAHDLANPGHPKDKIYGYKTWTNGPIAASYFVDNIGLPMPYNYAYGGRYGGSQLGATINVSYTFSHVPDGFAQVANYTSDPVASSGIDKTLHWVWIGNNDINIIHAGSIDPLSPRNAAFASDMARQTKNLVQNLVNAGAQHIFMPNLYAKQWAPITWKYYFVREPQNVTNFGMAIQYANDAIANALKPFGDKVIIYDAYGFIDNLYTNGPLYGFTQGQTMCDGSGDVAWLLCMVQGHAHQFFWMQYLMMTTKVYSLLAQDMANFIKAKYGVA